MELFYDGCQLAPEKIPPKRNSDNTPYDDVFKTLLVDCSRLIIPVINEMFGEHYTGKETVMFSSSEHHLHQNDGDTKEKRTDSTFKIMGDSIKKYHVECQSTADQRMIVRVFEYDVPVLRTQEYDLDTVFQKKLYMLLPFYIFVYERGLKEYEEDEARRQELQNVFLQIRVRLEELAVAGAVSEYEKCAILDMSRKVSGLAVKRGRYLLILS